MIRSPGVRVHVGVEIEGKTVPVAEAYVDQRRSAVSTVLTYDRSYVASAGAYALSPDLPLDDARHHSPQLPGAFADSAPDRWGRGLIARRMRSRSVDAGARTVLEVDFLLGVSDITRQGALRFAAQPDGPFLDTEAHVPKLVSLPRLLRAADTVAAGRSDDEMRAVKVLLDAGSGSLGGARPKASVLDGDDLAIAKFPHPGDQWDVMVWEKTALDLAELCGIRTPVRRLVDVGGRAVLLVDRFDREGRRRVGYISGMTMTGSADGDPSDYLELADAVAAHGSSVRADLAELWRRIAFSLVVNNVDDHLRNHGFLRAGSGWRFSPVFDLNPDPDPGATRVMSVGFETESQSAAQALLDHAPEFGLTSSAAVDRFDEIVASTREWRRVARANGAADRELALFAPAMDRFSR